MKVRYTKGAAAVLLEEVGRVKRGEWVEVSKETGERLIEQGWSSTSKKAKKDGASLSSTS
jgi:hypothetical protein